MPYKLTLAASLALQTLHMDNVFKRGVETVEQEEFVTGLDQSLAMMTQVLNDVLDFGRMEVGRFSIVKRPFVVQSMIQSILSAFKPTAAARWMVIQTDIQCPPTLVGDAVC